MMSHTLTVRLNDANRPMECEYDGALMSPLVWNFSVRYEQGNDADELSLYANLPASHPAIARDLIQRIYTFMLAGMFEAKGETVGDFNEKVRQAFQLTPEQWETLKPRVLAYAHGQDEREENGEQ